MKRFFSVLGVFGLILVVAVLFNNCSDTSFSNSGSSTTTADGGNGGAGGDGGDSGNMIGDDQLDEILNNLPEEEINNPIPVTELENDPTLYDRYRCPDSDGVVICHFPDNVESQHTLCVGRPAVGTHYSHLREYDLGDGLKEIEDYLGPCRVAL